MPQDIKKIIKGFSIVFTSIIISVFISYLIRIFLARRLSPSEFGLFFAVYTFIVFFSFFRDLGLNRAMTKFIPEFIVRKQFEKIKSGITAAFFIQLLTSLAFVALIIIFSDFLSTHYFKEPLSKALLLIMCIMFVLLVMDDLLKKIFLGFQKMHMFSFMEVAKNLIVFILLLLFFYLDFGVRAPAIAYVLASPLVFFLFLPFFLRVFNFFKYRLNINKKLVVKLVSFGIPTMFIGIGDKIISYMDILILTYFVPLSVVGVYNVVVPTALLFLFFSRAIALVLYPFSSELWAKNKKKRLSEILTAVQKFSFLIIVPFAFLLFFFANIFISTFFGSAYVSGATALRIFSVGIIFYSIAQINFSVISGTGFPGKVTRILLIASIVNIAFNLVLIPVYGIIGAAVGTSISYIVAFLLSNKALARIIKSGFFVSEFVKILIAGCSVLATCYILAALLNLPLLITVALTVIISLLIYAGLLFLLRVVDLGEIRNIVKSLFNPH